MRMDVQCLDSISESSSGYYETKTLQLTGHANELKTYSFSADTYKQISLELLVPTLTITKRIKIRKHCICKVFNGLINRPQFRKKEQTKKSPQNQNKKQTKKPKTEQKQKTTTNR